MIREETCATTEISEFEMTEASRLCPHDTGIDRHCLDGVEDHPWDTGEHLQDQDETEVHQDGSMTSDRVQQVRQEEIILRHEDRRETMALGQEVLCAGKTSQIEETTGGEDRHRLEVRDKSENTKTMAGNQSLHHAGLVHLYMPADWRFSKTTKTHLLADPHQGPTTMTEIAHRQACAPTLPRHAETAMEMYKWTAQGHRIAKLKKSLSTTCLPVLLQTDHPQQDLQLAFQVSRDLY